MSVSIGEVASLKFPELNGFIGSASKVIAGVSQDGSKLAVIIDNTGRNIKLQVFEIDYTTNTATPLYDSKPSTNPKEPFDFGTEHDVSGLEDFEKQHTNVVVSNDGTSVFVRFSTSVNTGIEGSKSQIVHFKYALGSFQDIAQSNRIFIDTNVDVGGCLTFFGKTLPVGYTYENGFDDLYLSGDTLICTLKGFELGFIQLKVNPDDGGLSFVKTGSGDPRTIITNASSVYKFNETLDHVAYFTAGKLNSVDINNAEPGLLTDIPTLDTVYKIIAFTKKRLVTDSNNGIVVYPVSKGSIGNSFSTVSNTPVSLLDDFGSGSDELAQIIYIKEAVGGTVNFYIEPKQSPFTPYSNVTMSSPENTGNVFYVDRNSNRVLCSSLLDTGFGTFNIYEITDGAVHNVEPTIDPWEFSVTENDTVKSYENPLEYFNNASATVEVGDTHSKLSVSGLVGSTKGPLKLAVSTASSGVFCFGYTLKGDLFTGISENHSVKVHSFKKPVATLNTITGNYEIPLMDENDPGFTTAPNYELTDLPDGVTYLPETQKLVLEVKKLEKELEDDLMLTLNHGGATSTLTVPKEQVNKAVNSGSPSGTTSSSWLSRNWGYLLGSGLAGIALLVIIAIVAAFVI